jgi:NAD(P)-dependent dehydrogenase (short-subunit alcohol dehydrogenase family)
MKKIVVLGGASGIGRAIVERFANEGWAVIFTGIESQKSDSEILKNTFGSDSIHFFSLDVRVNEQIEALGEFVKEKFGQIDAFVNSIGVSQQAHSVDSDFDYWDNTLQINMYGTVKTARILVPLILDGGRIVTISSIHNDRVAFGSSSYGMSKAAVVQYTRALALELAPKGILANTIAPGFVHTAMSIKDDGKNELESEWFHENYIKNEHLPLKRTALPEEIAGVAWFLAGPDATYIKGSVITVDGGLLTTF